MTIEDGKQYYFYDDRAEDNVCKAHVLHILPHPESDDDSARQKLAARHDAEPMPF